MLRGDDEIESLLSLMGSGSGQTFATTSQTATPRDGTSTSPPNLKPKPDNQHKGLAKKRKNEKTKKRNDGIDKRFKKSKRSKLPNITSFKDTRLSQNCFEWPCSNNSRRWLFLGSGLLHDCKGYVFSSDDQQHHNKYYGSIACQSCGKSAASHELCLSSVAEIFDDANNAHHPLSIMALASIIVAQRNTRSLLCEYYPTSTIHKQQTNPQMHETRNELLPPINSTPSSPGMISNELDVHVGRILVLVKKMQNKLVKPTQKNENKRRDFIKLCSVASISVSDAQLLHDKTSSLISIVQDYKRAVTIAGSSPACSRRNNEAISVIEKRLAAMASCDELYFRCYYSAVISRTSSDDNGSVMAAIIPHPPSYFSCPGLVWDVQNAGVEALRIFMGEDRKELDLAAPLDNSSKKVLLKSWGLEERLSATPLGAKNDIIDESNPFLSLWQSRFIETIRHIWCTRYSALKSLITLREASNVTNDANRARVSPNNSQESLLKLHETDAISPAVANWRDSIRDYPANFYAYAAPTNEALHAISNCLVSSGIEQILEAGAGTGYWSALLISHLKCCRKKCQILDKDEMKHRSENVIAYDVAPPSQRQGDGRAEVSNEYHGNIPTFTEVHKADTFSQALSESATSCAKSALLLCYPPPGCDMAQSALSAHISNGGHIVMHVGEWQGLTGDAAFEALMTQHFICHEKNVIHLPLWGTDATYLTIWRKKIDGEGEDTHAKGTSSWSPSMGYCSAKQCSKYARRRSRYARCLQYCSFNCYENHSSQRRAVLALHMIQTTSGDEMNYEDDRHFLDLGPITGSSSGMMSRGDTERKRRKKKKRR